MSFKPSCLVVVPYDLRMGSCVYACVCSWSSPLHTAVSWMPKHFFSPPGVLLHSQTPQPDQQRHPRCRGWLRRGDVFGPVRGQEMRWKISKVSCWGISPVRLCLLPRSARVPENHQTLWHWSSVCSVYRLYNLLNIPETATSWHILGICVKLKTAQRWSKMNGWKGNCSENIHVKRVSEHFRWSPVEAARVAGQCANMARRPVRWSCLTEISPISSNIILILSNIPICSIQFCTFKNSCSLTLVSGLPWCDDVCKLQDPPARESAWLSGLLQH